jgi:plastocyanin
MRKLLLLLLAAGTTLVAATPALAATRNVAITSTGFSPATVTITAGDTVTWRNRDTANHQVSSDTGAFVSPILRPNQTYSFTFANPGTYRYRDALRPAERGTVIVRDPPASVSLATTHAIVTYGTEARLFGAVSSKRAGETVTLYYRPYPQGSMVLRATLTTTTGGAWDFLIKPRLLTSYEAHYRNAVSPTVTVEVSPKITLMRTTRGLHVRVSGARSFGGRWVYLQRRSSLGQWVNVRKVVLTSRSTKLFVIPNFRPGRHSLRIFMTVNQAGTGYRASTSNTILLRRL